MQVRSIVLKALLEPPIADIPLLCREYPAFVLNRFRGAKMKLPDHMCFLIPCGGKRLMLCGAKDMTTALAQFEDVAKCLMDKMGVRVLEAEVLVVVGTIEMPGKIRLEKAYRALRQGGVRVGCPRIVHNKLVMKIGKKKMGDPIAIVWDSGMVICSGNKSVEAFEEHARDTEALLLPFVVG